MKNIFTFLFLISSICLYAQQTKTTEFDTTKIVSFVTNFDEPKMACKDGYAINGYIVNISYSQAKKINGKKIKITGLYNIVNGLENQPKEYDQNGNEIFMQGRLNDTKHIESPTIEIIDK